MPQQRLFQRGEMKCLVMHILQQGPAYGHELIKAVAKLVGDNYQPSPAVIYPALASLEAAGFICGTGERADAEGNKQFQVTEVGQQHLCMEADHIEEILRRIHEPQFVDVLDTDAIELAMSQLQQAVKTTLATPPITEETVIALTNILEQATRSIELSR
ncbi:PadR family transcriptional regulator [Shewanella avicenniae]|uniref:PadR family transcriptional regulator n=1 Tax=Shewanella avicenniae TaxID=2814294 RepID=A0ABX7QRG1_9GAMM|nr:PadR family transcriptional regulator [Shewanella avicenniae]QSX33859.1 PadR family transcriptional regulator [Shewanella avicenniae]